MNQKHVPDLELCQEFDRLCEEKGIVVPGTEYVWHKWSHHEEPWLLSVSEQRMYKREGAKDPEWTIPAPLVSELGEIFSKVGVKNFIKAYGDVFNFPGTSMIGDLGVINLMRNPNMGMKMINYLLKSGLITEL